MKNVFATAVVALGLVSGFAGVANAQDITTKIGAQTITASDANIVRSYCYDMQARENSASTAIGQVNNFQGVSHGDQVLTHVNFDLITSADCKVAGFGL